MRDVRLITTSIGDVAATVELEITEGGVTYIGKVVGFGSFFCYSETEEECLNGLTKSFEIYLNILLRRDLENLNVTFGDGKDQ